MLPPHPALPDIAEHCHIAPVGSWPSRLIFNFLYRRGVIDVIRLHITASQEMASFPPFFPVGRGM